MIAEEDAVGLRAAAAVAALLSCFSRELQLFNQEACDLLLLKGESDLKTTNPSTWDML